MYEQKRDIIITWYLLLSPLRKESSCTIGSRLKHRPPRDLKLDLNIAKKFCKVSIIRQF